MWKKGKKKFKKIKPVDPELFKGWPSREKHVRVMHGKHKDKIGLVTWHGPSSFSKPLHKNIWVAHAIGREGYRVKIKTKTNEEFFVDAEHVEVIRKEGQDGVEH